jgi:hypothetical protein
MFIHSIQVADGSHHGLYGQGWRSIQIIALISSGLGSIVMSAAHVRFSAMLNCRVKKICPGVRSELAECAGKDRVVTVPPPMTGAVASKSPACIPRAGQASLCRI